MKTRKLVLATLITTSLAGISLYSNAQQLTQKGFINGFYATTSQDNEALQLKISIENNYNKTYFMDGWISTPDKDDVLNKIKQAITQRKSIEFTYDDNSKHITSAMLLADVKHNNRFNKRSANLLSVGIFCGGVTAGFTANWCTPFTDNNGRSRRLAFTGGALAHPGVQAFGGTLSIDNLPNISPIDCSYDHFSIVFFHRLDITCDNGKYRGSINAGGIGMPSFAGGQAIIE